jgi:molecular chaperone GrpE
MAEDNNQEEQLDIEQLQKELSNALEQSTANLNGWKRSQADFENYKKRQENENKEILEFAKQVTVVKLLPILDSLQQGLRHLPAIENEQLKVWQKGIEGTLLQLDSALAGMGIKKIEALGKKFDPNFHEAVREVPGEEDQIITEELQTGYELNGKVIRPSQVIISKKSN